MVGDRVAQLGILVGVEQEVSVGPVALPGSRVGIQGPADDQAVPGDVPVQLALAGRAVVSTGPATEEASQSGIV